MDDVANRLHATAEHDERVKVADDPDRALGTPPAASPVSAGQISRNLDDSTDDELFALVDKLD